MHKLRYNKKDVYVMERETNVSFLLGWEWLGKDEKTK